MNTVGLSPQNTVYAFNMRMYFIVLDRFQEKNPRKYFYEILAALFTITLFTQASQENTRCEITHL